MKGGHTPIHIQRFAPADYHGDEYVQLLEKRRDYRALTFYRHFIDFAFMSGGDLPADVETLAAIVRMPARDVRKALEFCLGRLVFQEGDRLYQRRVKREVVAELGYRAVQSQLGREGGKAAGRGRPKNKDRGTPNTPLPSDRGTPVPSIGPPSSSPSSSPAPAPPPDESPPVADATVVDATADDGESGSYVDEVLDFYRRLPGTRDRPTRADHRTARELQKRGVPLETARAGLLLATARRELRDHAVPLPLIGSLAYFLDTIEEVQASPVDDSYIQHLAARLKPPMKGASPQETPEERPQPEEPGRPPPDEAV